MEDWISVTNFIYRFNLYQGEKKKSSSINNFRPTFNFFIVQK